MYLYVLKKFEKYLYFTYLSTLKCTWTYACKAVADLGGLGGCIPPPAISGHTKGWMCCYKTH